MSQARFKIVFNGELMPDVALETAKDNLSRLFKSDGARINALFSGSPIEIKRGLSESEADQYLAALQRAGAKVRKEQDGTASLSLVASDDHPKVASQPLQPASNSTDMTCPKCGQQQPKAAECSACGIIIEKFIARQALYAEAPASDAGATASPYATPKATVAEVLPEFGELKPLSSEGRIGRLRYLAWSLVLMFACMPLLGVAAGFFAVSEILGGVLMAVVGVAIAVVGILFGVQRLHDIGWSGWLLLLNLVPVVGGVFSLLMFIIPGSTEANRFGPPPPPNSTAVKVLAALWLGIIVLGIVAAIALPAYMGYADAGL
ncbi:DUF805 domain-containing protein [Pseudomonas sp.]|uniref:DUF805 domain-containing protein n=1 Tax=Pseudomonas sp. TaxID=306 RepID=UPI0027367670|nr:DUF805 domain-containing protein [Pseudomonas sp.]MDP3814785.1 DUF805 domain-containing protein [Pseudomonas sp.]